MLKPTPMPKLDVTRKTGDEAFRCEGTDAGFRLLDFWRWSASDPVSNATRGVLAEYIVARAIDLSRDEIRDEWAPCDLEAPDGCRIEVKSAAYIQSWTQKRLSQIVFRIPKTCVWNADTGDWEGAPRRHADIYVFALLKHEDKETIDPLNLDQWEFYVVRAEALGERKEVSGRWLRRRTPPVAFGALRAAVLDACGRRDADDRRR